VLSRCRAALVGGALALSALIACTGELGDDVGHGGLPQCGTYTTRDNDGLCICIAAAIWCAPEDPNDLNCCLVPTVCGDGRCMGVEAASNCPQDCAPSAGDVCGDGWCGGSESAASCPQDCTPTAGDVCGDGRCTGWESPGTCPADCAESPAERCGDFQCTTWEIYTCGADCGDAYVCGDGVCLSAEAANGCAIDCAVGELITDHDAPDFVVMVVSGHCFGSCPGGVNAEYLAEQGTADEVAWVFESRGYTVDVLDYADSLYDYTEWGDFYLPTEGRDLVDGWGFLTLLRELAEIRDRWIAGNPNPPRVIVVAHSHGNVWASLAMHLLWDVPIDVWVSLDAVSTGWEDDTSTLLVGDRWRSEILAYSSRFGIVWPWEVWRPTSVFRVGGVSDLKDLVPPNVVLSLEVSGTQLISPITDMTPNVRNDGTYADIVSVQVDEVHEDLDDPDSYALFWVTTQLAIAYGLD
jgi:hypothetical protein